MLKNLFPGMKEGKTFLETFEYHCCRIFFYICWFVLLYSHLLIDFVHKFITCQSQGKFDNFRDFMPNLHLHHFKYPPSMVVLQQAPAQDIIWGYVAECDSKLTATFTGKMLISTTSTGTANDLK